MKGILMVCIKIEQMHIQSKLTFYFIFYFFNFEEEGKGTRCSRQSPWVPIDNGVIKKR